MYFIFINYIFITFTHYLKMFEIQHTFMQYNYEYNYSIVMSNYSYNRYVILAVIVTIQIYIITTYACMIESQLLISCILKFITTLILIYNNVLNMY